MATDLKVIDSALPIDLGVADEIIAGLKGRLTGLSADTHSGYQMVKAGISEVRKLRTDVERSRKELKQSALDWGRKVDAEAKRVTSLILEIETPLKEEKARIDDEAERKRKEAEEAERLAREAQEKAEREEREAQEKAEREEREAQEKAEREEERKQREAERLRLEAEREQLAEERRKIDEANEKLRVERESIEAERRAHEEKARAEEEVREATERAERERELSWIQAEADRKRKQQQEEDAAILAEERKPDREKLKDVATLITDLVFPDVKTEWAAGVLANVSEKLSDAHVIINAALNEDS